MNRRSHYVRLLTLWLIIATSVGPAFGWNDRGHRDLTDRALGASGLDAYLRDELLLGLGLGEEIPRTGLLGVKRQRVRDWIGDGSVREDSPVLRVQNHFHNPTLDWLDAGLNRGLLQGQSALLFAQNRDQPSQHGGERMAWQDARALLRDALTAPARQDRNTAFADLFLALGHQVHLIQDQANPAHTRNDAHPAHQFRRMILGDPDRFHFWAESQTNLNSAFTAPGGGELAAQRPDGSVLSRAANSLAPIPTARLIDTEQYRAQYPDKTTFPPAGLDIGLAEYSSAHFFSDDTILRRLDFPSLGTTFLDNGTIDPRTGRRRWYVLSRSAPTPEVPSVAVATISTLSRELPDLKKTTALKLNSKVFTDTSKLLFPRAVGYSSELLDYFFRARFDADLACAAAIVASAWSCPTKRRTWS